MIALVLAFGAVAGWPGHMPKMAEKFPRPLAALALEVSELQQKVLAPAAPVAGLLGITSEDWPLFPGTGGTRYRMWVEARKKRGGYTLLYRPHDDQHTYLAGALEYRRVLNVWNPHHDWISGGYQDYVHWLAGRIFDDFANYREVRVRMEEVTIRGGGAGFEPTDRFVYEETVRRSEIRP